MVKSRWEPGARFITNNWGAIMAPAIASLIDAPLAPNRPSPERSIGFVSLRPQLEAMSALVAASNATQDATHKREVWRRGMSST